VDKGVENYGQVSYPAGADTGLGGHHPHPGGCDRLDGSFLVQLDAMTDTDHPVVAIGVDTTATPGPDRPTGASPRRRDARRGPRADHDPFDGVPRRSAASDATVASAAGTPDGFGGVVEVTLPRADLGTTSTWRLWAGAGVWDAATQQWAAPQAVDPGPSVLDLGFPQRRRAVHAVHEHGAGVRVAPRLDGTVSKLGTDVHADGRRGLASPPGENQTWRLTSGYYIRQPDDIVRDGQSQGHPSNNPQAEGVSARQPVRRLRAVRRTTRPSPRR